MNIKTLSTFLGFKCIAGDCRHSCCIGWEIDIDEETFQSYMKEPGPFGDRLRSSISSDPCPHFVIDENERCPFLNGNGLCDLILELGEDRLCDICTDHPRYRNPGEIGIGLCCEEASRLIIEEKGPITIVDSGIVDDDEVPEFLFEKERQLMLDILNSDMLFEEKVKKCLKIADSSLEPFEKDSCVAFLLDLERLDPSWEEYLSKMVVPQELTNEENKIFSNVAIYFLHRYLAQSVDEEDFSLFTAFSFRAVRMIISIFQGTKKRSEDLLEILRMFSSEIEYSDENIDKIVFY